MNDRARRSLPERSIHSGHRSLPESLACRTQNYGFEVRPLSELRRNWSWAARVAVLRTDRNPMLPVFACWCPASV